jgi:ABC-type multidrug transport system fused ATPase/permease subunit
MLDQFSIEIAPGERVGITGPSGRGKTTLIEMIFGTLDPDTGLVEVDDLEVQSLRLEALRERIAMVAEPEIFEGTILDNVLLGRSLSTEAVHDALRKVGLLDAFASLPDGVLTRLTSKGVPLSDGQIHRLMLARAIVGEPRLLLVDALLDVMSPASLEELLDVLTDPAAPWTLVIVSNREQVLRRCDRVIDLSSVEVEPGRRLFV